MRLALMLSFPLLLRTRPTQERKSLLHVMHVEEAAAAKMQAASRGAAARSKLRSRTTV